MSQPEALEPLLVRLLKSLGMPSPSVMSVIKERWSELAGEPWASQSRPLYIRQKELVVEAPGPLLGVLRYAVGDLMRRLDDGVGPGLVETVRVVPKGSEI